MANPIVLQISAELEALQKELGKFKSTVDYLNQAKNYVNDAVQSVNYSEENFNKKIEELKNTYTSFIKLTDAVSAVITKIDTINFPERLDSIEKTVKETITYLNDIRKATLDELHSASKIITNVDFDGKFKNLQSSIDSSVKSNNELSNSIEKQKIGDKIVEFEKVVSKRIHESFKEVEKNTKQIADDTTKSIHDLNLPIRMDKLDANISGILTAIQNVQGRLDLVERNISDKLREVSEKQASTLSVLQDKFMQGNIDLTNEIRSASKKQQINAYITWGLIVLSVIAILLISKLN